MPRFLAIYTGAPGGRADWEALDEATRKAREAEGMAAWGAWGERYGAAIVDGGGPLGKTKRVETAGVSDIRNAMAAYTIVEADSHAAAAKMFENHPHFAIFPGDGVEIMEVLAIPGA